jgi:hypothetical protein
MIKAFPILLLAVCWHFEGAWAIPAAVWRIVNDASAYISDMSIPEDILILYNKEQNTFMRTAPNNHINFPLICWKRSSSFFSWPNGRNGRGSVILSASNNDVIYGVRQFAINRKDGIAVSSTACAGEYGGGDPKILKMITKYGGTSPLASWAGSRWSTMDKIGGQPEAVKDRADIGPHLSVLRVSSCDPLDLLRKSPDLFS